MLTPDEVVIAVRSIFARRQAEIAQHELAYGYVTGALGVPSVPEGSNDELHSLARMSVKNVCGVVVSTFAQALTVTGFRDSDSALAQQGWALWQQEAMDARQDEVHRAALTYGSAYVVVLPDEDEAAEVSLRIRTPRQVTAVYSDPSTDRWPVMALETWIDRSGKDPLRMGRLIDGEAVYPVILGKIGVSGEVYRPQPVYDESLAWEHGFSVCPVVRFINRRDAEDVVTGEVAPLIPLQRSLNSVNFDRLVVSRHAAYPQRYAIGWAPSSKTEQAKAGVSRLMAFEDADVKVGSFAAANLEQYNSILTEMQGHIAQVAQVPAFAITGSVSNIGTDTMAALTAPYDRKVKNIRESLGEAWEQVFGLMLDGAGYARPSDSCEVTWQDTEVRSFAATVDALVKLASAGIPLDALLPMVPGWTVQQVEAVRARMQGTENILATLQQIAGASNPLALGTGADDGGSTGNAG